MPGSRIAVVFTFLLAVFVLSPAAVEQPPVVATPAPHPLLLALDDSLSAYFEATQREGQFVGASVAVIIGDSLQLLRSFGHRDHHLKDSLDNQTVFRIGSLSKGFAGVLAGMLVADGLMEWEEPVIGRLPDFRMRDTSHSNRITMAQLLSHTAGFPYHSYTNLVEEGWSLTRIAEEFKTLRPVNEPGELYSYQNAAFSLAGEMMGKATGRTFEQLLHERIFRPLNMMSASANREDMKAWNNYALPHLGSPGHWRSTSLHNRYYNTVPAGGINASITDMAEWLRLLLGQRPDLISQQFLDQVFRPYIRTNIAYRSYKRWPGHQQSYYAMGWRVHTFQMEDGNADTLIHHGGYVNGYRGEIAIAPDSGIGICVLFNSPSPMARTVVPRCLETIQSCLDTNKEL